MKSIIINNKNNEIGFSRHSSMVLSDFRNLGLFSYLLEKVKKFHLQGINIVIMWPNNKNFANFNIKEKNLIKRKLYLYRTNFHNINKKKLINYDIKNLVNYKKSINNSDTFIRKI